MHFVLLFSFFISIFSLNFYRLLSLPYSYILHYIQTNREILTKRHHSTTLTSQFIRLIKRNVFTVPAESEEQQRLRFQVELEFVQCLANPNYLHCKYFIIRKMPMKQSDRHEIANSILWFTSESRRLFTFRFYHKGLFYLHLTRHTILQTFDSTFSPRHCSAFGEPPNLKDDPPKKKIS